MFSNVFISIITVSYNSEKTISRTIESVLSQNFDNYEYIIIDGLSSDKTVDIVNSYLPLFEQKLRLISEPDNGIYDAMNKGIKLSKGNYVWLVNADDWIEPNALSLIFKFHQDNNLKYDKLIQGGINIRDFETLELKHRKIVNDGKMFKKYSSKLQMGIIHPSIIVPKCIYNKIGLYDDRYYISADVDFAIRCYRNKVNLVCLKSVLSNMSDGGISNQLPFFKNWHDWNLRYEKFCSNIFYKTYCLSLSSIKLLLRKYLPKTLLNKMLHQ